MRLKASTYAPTWHRVEGILVIKGDKDEILEGIERHLSSAPANFATIFETNAKLVGMQGGPYPLADLSERGAPH